jgi:hypothetical protein
MRGRRGLVALWLVLLVAMSFVAPAARAGAEHAAKTVTGTAEWRNGKGDCNTGIDVPNYVNGTGSPYVKVDMPTTVVVDGRHVTVAWRDPGSNHGPWFGPVSGDIADDDTFELTGHNEYDPSWTWKGTVDGDVMEGRFTRRAVFAAGQPPCTATWDVTLRLDDDLALGDTDRAAAGTELCPTVVTGGALEPTQGVWQHDPVFADRPGKQLREISKTAWNAELPMVLDRPTLLFGFPEHDAIKVTGTTTGTKALKTRLDVSVNVAGVGSPMHERLSLSKRSQGTKFFAPCGKEHPFVVEIAVPKGAPATKAFKFRVLGDYTITAQVESGGKQLTPSIKVTGSVVKTAAPRTLIVPVTLGKVPAKGSSTASGDALAQDAKDVAQAMGRWVVDLYPVASFPVDVGAVYYARDDFTEHKLYKQYGEENINGLVDDVKREVAKRGLMSQYDKVIALVPKPHYESIEPVKTGSDGFSASEQFVVIADNIDPGATTPASADTVATEAAHEIAHTSPYLWSAGQMQRDCGRNYHDVEGSNVAYGYRITRDGVESRQAIDGIDSFMSQIYRDPSKNWIDQCTYKHLLDQLLVKPK